MGNFCGSCFKGDSSEFVVVTPNDVSIAKLVADFYLELTEFFICLGSSSSTTTGSSSKDLDRRKNLGKIAKDPNSNISFSFHRKDDYRNRRIEE